MKFEQNYEIWMIFSLRMPIIFFTVLCLCFWKETGLLLHIPVSQGVAYSFYTLLYKFPQKC